MTARHDLEGRKFGLLTVMKRVKHDSQTIWRCQCTCGHIRNVRGSAPLLQGLIASCGDSECRRKTLRCPTRRKGRMLADAKARTVAEAIVANLNGRSGFDAWWGVIRPDTQEEILSDLMKVVQEAGR